MSKTAHTLPIAPVCWLLALGILTSCSTLRTSSIEEGEAITLPVNNDHMVMPVMWRQSAAESEALTQQIFHQARYSLDRALQKRKSTLPPAVITNIDDTILDTSPYQASLITEMKEFPAGWNEWVAKGSASAVPGAPEFLQYAAKRGVKIFYTTQRDPKHAATVFSNLKREGFPLDNSEVIYTKSDTAANYRRIQETHEIVLIIGDQLNDFSSVFHDARPSQRQRQVDFMKNKFGETFILIPNPMYGAWEDAHYDYDDQLNQEQKGYIRKGQLEM